MRYDAVNAMLHLALSLQLYGEERYVESIVASRRALHLRPGLRRSAGLQ